MRTHTYGERDYAFGQAMLTRRAVMHLTQVDLARFLAISRGAVLAWEAGSSYPKAEHLKAFIALCVEPAWICRILPFGERICRGSRCRMPRSPGPRCVIRS